MITVEVNALRVYAFHGVLPQERVVGNEYEVTLHVDLEADEAVKSDELAGTISYADLVEIINDEMMEPSNLLEHVAGRIQRAVTDRWSGIRSGAVRIAKLTPPIAGSQMASAAVKLRW